ncbi:HAD-like protein [Meredithblackwellia eburnea MCA 4105]
MILSDVDGTLFTDKHELHPTTLNAIKYIRETRPDLPIIPVTGKQRVSCGSLIDDLDISKFPAGCLHGAILYDPQGNVEQHRSLEPTFVRGVTDLMKKHNKTTMLYVADWVAMASLEQGGKTDWEAVSRGFDPCVRDARETDFLDKVASGEEKIGKIFLPMDEEDVPTFLDLLKTSFPDTPFKTTRALPYIIEIVADGVDKSGALEYFCSKFDIKPENVLTFGDGENDVGMFKAAGYAVSMGNAMEAPRKAADYATATNNEGGVGQFLDRVFRPSFPDAALPVDNIKSLDSLSAGHDAVEIVA